MEPIPDRLIVLTFDDGKKSNATFAAPLLSRHGFGATFFITEGLEFSDKSRYMAWDEIKGLHDAGFEILGDPERIAPGGEISVGDQDGGGETAGAGTAFEKGHGAADVGTRAVC